MEAAFSVVWLNSLKFLVMMQLFAYPNGKVLIVALGVMPVILMFKVLIAYRDLCYSGVN